MVSENNIIQRDDPILITGANGFIGSRVVARFAQNGFTNIRCLARESSNVENLLKIKAEFSAADISLHRGNLLSKAICRDLTQGAKLVVHLAAGRGGKSYSVSFLNSVVTSKNLLESLKNNAHLMRFLNVSSFTVYANRRSKPGALLDESSEVEANPLRRGEPYCYSKVQQEKMLRRFADRYAIPVVNVRPGAVYGPGNSSITGRVGIDTFGIFLHFGGQNKIPLSYVDNCAYAIYKCGLAPGIDGEDFNIVDSDLPTSREFLDLYKINVRNFR